MQLYDHGLEDHIISYDVVSITDVHYGVHWPHGHGGLRRQNRRGTWRSTVWQGSQRASGSPGKKWGDEILWRPPCQHSCNCARLPCQTRSHRGLRRRVAPSWNCWQYRFRVVRPTSKPVRVVDGVDGVGVARVSMGTKGHQVSDPLRLLHRGLEARVWGKYTCPGPVRPVVRPMVRPCIESRWASASRCR